MVARTHDELQAAIGPNTAMIYTTILGDRLKEAIAIAKRANVPLLLDDAAGIPPIENLRLYAKMGADLFCFSGGKGLVWPAVFRSLVRQEGPHRSGAWQIPVRGKARFAGP